MSATVVAVRGQLPRRPWRRVVHQLSRTLSTASGTEPVRGKAYFHKPSDLPLISMTSGQLLDSAWEKHAERTALISYHENHRLTYDQLRDKADRLAAGLLSLGLTRGDRVAMWGPNSSQWVITKLAVARAGLTLVTLNPAYQVREIRHCLAKVGVKALVCDHTFKTQDYHKLVLDAAPDVANCKPGQIQSEVFPDLKTVIVITDQTLPAALRFEDAMAAGTAEGIGQVRASQDELDPDEVCEIQFTSGTTGEPKAAMLTNHNMINNAYFFDRRVNPERKPSVVCTLVPFFHIYSSVVTVLASLMGGHTLLNPSPTYTAEAAFKAMRDEKAEMVYGAPTMFIDLLEELRKTGGSGLESVHYMMCGASVASPEMQRALKKALPHARVRQGYGMTETSPVTFAIPLEADDDAPLKYVGCLMEHLEAKVVDSNGKTVRFGEKGELCIRGYVNCRGYWKDPVKTKELITDGGWLRTGDQFILHENGFGQIVGRIKELIIRGGENIAPREVEDLLSTHSNIVEVAVFGVYDDRMGEEVAAAIRVRDSKESLTVKDVKAFLKGKISHFKIPRYVEVVEEFPKTASGKIQKFKLKAQFEEKLGLTAK